MTAATAGPTDHADQERRRLLKSIALMWATTALASCGGGAALAVPGSGLPRPQPRAREPGGASWNERTTAPGVLFAHDFTEDAELTSFVRGAQAACPLTLVGTPFGAARAIRSRAIGSPIVETTPAGVAGDLQWWRVADASVFPDPGATPYPMLVGRASVGAIEWVEVHAVDAAGSRLRVKRRPRAESLEIAGVAYPWPRAGAYAGDGSYTIGKGPDGSWNRPLCALRAGDNGRTQPDVGVGNGAARKMRSWDPRQADRHARFREAYWGHASYWDAERGDARYRHWRPHDAKGAEGGTRLDAFEGDELWIQFRAKVDASRFAAPRAKMLFLQNADTSGSGQFFWQVGPKDYDTSPGNYGSVLVPLTAFDDSAAPAGGTLSVPQRAGLGFAGAEIQSAQSFPQCQWQHGASRACWRFPADEWVTYLLHFKFGRDNAPLNPVDPARGGSDGAASTLGLRAPFPAASDADHRTTFELFVARDGDAEYTQITSSDRFAWFFGDGKYQAGYYHYNPPGLNTLWLGQNLNDYVGSGSVAPPPLPHAIEYTQLVVSRQRIAVPSNWPAYMRDMAPYSTRLLRGTLAPSRGGETFVASLPAEWRPAEGAPGSRGVIAAWSGGCADHANKRLFFAGAGHSDGANNGIHVYDFGGDERPLGFSVLAGSRSRLADVVEDGPGETYADGRPSAVHTYSCMQYDAARRRIWRSGGARYSSGGGGAQVWTFSIDGASWAQRAGHAAGASSVMLQAPDASAVLVIGTLNAPRFIDAVTYAQTLHGAAPWPGLSDHNAAAAYDEKRDRHLMIARNSVAPQTLFVHQVAVDWRSRRWTATPAALRGSDADVAKAAGGMGMFYDAQRDSFWAFGSVFDTAGGAIAHLLEIDAATLEVRRTPLSPALACGSYSRGTFGRFIWMPEWRTVGIVYDHDKPAALIRLP